MYKHARNMVCIMPVTVKTSVFFTTILKAKKNYLKFMMSFHLLPGDTTGR